MTFKCYHLIGLLLLMQACLISCEEATDLPEEDDKHDAHHLAHRVNTGEHWVQSFIWNIIGYALIIIPAYFFIRMIKTTNFYEKEGEGLSFRMIQCCVFGKPTKETLKETTKQPLLSCLAGTSQSAVTCKLLLCVIGLQTSYLTWGVLQEKVMTTKYGEGENAVNFHNSEFLVFMNRIIALAVAAFYIILTGPSWSGPFYRYSFSSLSNICSSWCQYEALKFVSFPTQVLGKASKMIPVMIMGKIISKKTYQKYEYVVAIMISVGVSMFLLSTASDKHTSAETTLSGFILMIGYMGFDSFTANWQAKLFQEYKVSSMQMMFNVNSFSALLTVVPLIISGGLTYAIHFITEHPSFGTHILIISLTSATGQLFIFYTISEFGPLVFTIIMVTRQMFSILLSCILYQHYLTTNAVFGVFVVFAALFLQIYAKYRIRQKELLTKALAQRQESDMA